jgi:hypothetical protein
MRRCVRWPLRPALTRIANKRKPYVRAIRAYSENETPEAPRPALGRPGVSANPGSPYFSSRGFLISSATLRNSESASWRIRVASASSAEARSIFRAPFSFARRSHRCAIAGLCLETAPRPYPTCANADDRL